MNSDYMGIRLFFGNEITELADETAASVIETAGGDPFAEATIIVPNANLAEWLRLHFAVGLGISAGIRFDYLESGLFSMIRRAAGAGEDVSPLTRDDMEILLIRILDEVDQNDTALAPMVRYLYREEGGTRPGFGRRVRQLAGRFSRLFEEYAFHRPEMIAEWAGTEDPWETSGSIDEDERCQRFLYRWMLDRRDAVFSDPEKKRKTLFEWANALPQNRYFAATPNSDRPAECGRVHFFGFSHISPFHLDTLHRLSAFFDLYMFVLNPCREFWEDYDPETGNPLLEAWGRPGREHVAALCRLTNYDFTDLFQDPESLECAPGDGPAVLSRIRRDILTRRPPGGVEETIPADRSLQIFAAPEAMRAVESVRNNIRRQMAGDPDLNLTDIAVLVTDMNRYRPLLEAVFLREPHPIPYNRIDSNAAVESVFGRAVIDLLRLSRSNFSRGKVLSLIANECLQTAFGFSPETGDSFVEAVDAAGIYRAFDRSEAEARRYYEVNRYTWKQGLLRMQLSRIMARTDAPDSPDDDFKGHVPVPPAGGDIEALVDRLIVVVEAIGHAVGRIRAAEVKPAGRKWKETLLPVIDGLFAIPPDRPWEAAVRRRLTECLDRFAELDDAPGGRVPDVETVETYLAARLSEINAGSGDYVTGGVAVSALMPMRPVPFSIIYVLGLEEGTFPGREPSIRMDLRNRRRKQGDVSRLEINRYLLLEVLMSARRRLYLGYVSRDLVNDRIIAPSGPLRRLQAYLADLTGTAYPVTEVPLSPADPRYFQPEAVSAASDVLAFPEPADVLRHYRETGLFETVRNTAEQTPMVSAMIRDWRDEFARKPPPAPEPVTPVRVPVKWLADFLIDPVNAAGKRHLQLRADESDPEEAALVEDEPFFSEFPVTYQLTTRPLMEWADAFLRSEETDPDARFFRWYKRFQRAGKTPAGFFADLDKTRLHEDFRARVNVVSEKIPRPQSGDVVYADLILGDPPPRRDRRETTGTGFRFPAPVFQVANSPWLGAAEVAVEIHGRLPFVWKSSTGGVSVLIPSGRKATPKKGTIDKYFLHPVLFYLAALTTKEGEHFFADRFRVYISYQTGAVDREYRFSPKAAADYLHRLIAWCFGPEAFVWFPFETVTQILSADDILAENADSDKRRTFALAMQDALLECEEETTRLIRPRLPVDPLATARIYHRPYFQEAPAP